MGFGLGPVISSDGKGIVYGAAAGLNYFVIDRLSLGVNAGAIFASTYRDYSVGPALTYFVGPFGGYLLTPSYSAKHFIQGSINAEGWAYGLLIGLMTNLVGRIYWGISVGYYTFQVEAYKEQRLELVTDSLYSVLIFYINSTMRGRMSPALPRR